MSCPPPRWLASEYNESCPLCSEVELTGQHDKACAAKDVEARST